MSSPAERYAAAKRRIAQERTELHQFRANQEFELDEFQIDGCTALEEGNTVLVAAPTGAGKTVVGEFAVYLGLISGRKTFYTTPIKALSNQKYTDFCATYGPENVGLLTGDTSINGEAPIVVMTTEVLRNMIYARSRTLDSLAYVVMDEVHYLADRFRGPVWEEVILNLDATVRIVALSATVSNAEEFGQWLGEVRGPTRVVVSEKRPVPLWQHMMVGKRILDLHALGEGRDGDPLTSADIKDPPLNPELVDAINQMSRQDGPRGGGPHGRGRGRRYEGGKDGRSGHGARGHRGHGRGKKGRTGGARRDDVADRGPATHSAGPKTPAYISRAQVIDALDRGSLLPAIIFIFSRAGCEDAVLQVISSGVRLTSRQEAAHIRDIVDEALAGVPAGDLAVLGIDTWRVAVERGVAAHHAGLLPVLKQTVERLFTAGLVKVVFATETLALGVNMPARSVVLEKLVKWDGTSHVNLTPGEYTQLTGRAGRRGIDIEGHAVVQWSPGVDPVHVGTLASRRTYPLRSAFHPTYNMAVNLLRHRSLAHAREILESSFAQFQADQGVVGLARQVRRLDDSLQGYAEAMTCHLGDFTEYAALREQISARESALSAERSGRRRRAAAETMRGLRRGDVLAYSRGRRTVHAVVLETDETGFEGPTLTVLTSERQVRALTVAEAPEGVTPVTRVRVPKNWIQRDVKARRDLASTMRNALADTAYPDPVRVPASADGELAELRAQLRAHPCHGCSHREDHARWANRWMRTRAELDELHKRIAGRTGTLAVDLDHICDVLQELGYLDQGEEAGSVAVTEDGVWLGRLYSEKDLLIAECLKAGVWGDLEPEELAAVVTAVVYEGREDRLPMGISGEGALRGALEDTQEIAAGLTEVELRHRVRPTAQIDLGLVSAMHAWTHGADLAEVLQLSDVGAGDFVRWSKQLLDVLDQIAVAAPSVQVAQRAAIATTLVRRGVVAWSGL